MPFIIILLILVYFTLLGLAVPAACNKRVSRTLAMCSPGMGMGILLPLTLLLSRAGIPVLNSAAPLVAVLGLAAVIILAVRRPILPWRELALVLPACLIAIAIAGAPLAVFGFDWLANANDDMLVYVLSANNFMHLGFFHLPTVDQLVAGTNVGDNVWFWEILPPNRYGTDALLAVIASVTHMEPVYIYMPCSVVGLVSLVLAVSALCRTTSTMMIASILCAIASPISLFSVYQQILPQLLGIGTLVAFVAIICMPGEESPSILQRGISLGFTYTALVYVYPELSPILIAGALVWLSFGYAFLRANVRAICAVAGIALGTVVVLLNVQIPTVIATFGILFGVTQSLGTLSPINYYLLPSGFANFWGFVPLGLYPDEPWFSAAILCGFIGLALVGVWAARQLRSQRDFLSAMVVAILLMCLALFARRSSYAIFKMAFILHPFVLPLVAQGVVFGSDWLSQKARILRERPVAAMAALVAIAVLMTSYSTYNYLFATSDLFVNKNASWAELHGASTHDVLGQARAIGVASGGPTVANPAYISDTALTQLALILGLSLRGHSLEFEGFDAYTGLYHNAINKVMVDLPGWPKGERPAGKAEAKLRMQIVSQRRLAYGNAAKTSAFYLNPYVDPSFTRAPKEQSSRGMFIETGPHLTILNNSRSGADYDLRAVPWDSVSNWLVLVDSDIGRPPDYPAEKGNVAFEPVEPDPFHPGHIISTVGRSMLLEVVHPTPRVRLSIHLSASFNPDNQTRLPDVTVIGTSTVRVSLHGSSGAARILTPPVEPFVANGHRYIVLKLGQRLLHFTVRRSGLMKLFGNDIELDPRVFALFSRDISAIGDAPPAPHGITALPDDLMDPALAYRGIYEDAWLSADFGARLKSYSPSDVLVLNAMVPQTFKGNTVSVTIDGKVVRRFFAGPGNDIVRIQGIAPGEHDVGLRVPSATRISQADPRKAWGRLVRLAFESTTEDIFRDGTTLKDDGGWYPVERDQHGPFRWAKDGANFEVPASNQTRVVRISAAPGPSSAGSVTFSISRAGSAQKFTIGAERDVELRLPPSATAQELQLRIPKAQRPAPGDKRNLTLRVFAITLSGAGP